MRIEDAGCRGQGNKDAAQAVRPRSLHPASSILILLLLPLLTQEARGQTLFDPDSVSEFDIFTAAIISATNLGATTFTSTGADFDWSGIGWQNTTSGTKVVNCTSAFNLISDRHALAGHCAIAVGATAHFRSPDGTERTATVAASTSISSANGIRLIRFSSAVHASIDRMPIAINSGRLVGELYWAPQHSGNVALRRVTSMTAAYVFHEDGGWGDAESSSGKPGVVPLSDGTFALMGIAHYTNAQDRIENWVDELNAAMAAYSETVTTFDVDPEGEDPRRLILVAP